MLFTTSWDDGHSLDLRVAELLERFGMTGTFYIGKNGRDNVVLDDPSIRLLAERHEVGAHSLTHPSLPDITDLAMLRKEIGGSKEWLEGITKKPCTMFAYPFGRFDAHTQAMVREVGFRAARAVKDYSWDATDIFALPTTVAVHVFPFRPVWNRRFIQPFQRHHAALRACGVSLWECRSWLSMAKAVFRFAVQEKKPWFHLWGHSWSLEKFGLWGAFESFLSHVAAHDDIHYAPNSSLLS